VSEALVNSQDERHIYSTEWYQKPDRQEGRIRHHSRIALDPILALAYARASDLIKRYPFVERKVEPKANAR
jgi:hypothetical protein